MPRHISRTYQRAAQAHSKVMAARQSMLSRTPAPAVETEEPMRRYVFPISQPVRTAPAHEELSAALTQVLEHQAAQEQLLTDLLEAVKALTSALLNQVPKD